MIHPNVCFLILLICCWVVTASLMAIYIYIYIYIYILYIYCIYTVYIYIYIYIGAFGSNNKIIIKYSIYIAPYSQSALWRCTLFLELFKKIKD